MYNVTLSNSLFPAQNDAESCEITVGGLLRDVAAARPDAEALVEVRQDGSEGRRWTYAGVLADAERLAMALSTRFAPGERVVVWSPNSPEWVLMEYACALSGLVLVTANPAFQARELAYVLEQSGAVALFLVEEFRGNPMGRIGAEVTASIPSVREVTDMKSDALFAEGARPLALPDVGLGRRRDDPIHVRHHGVSKRGGAESSRAGQQCALLRGSLRGHRGNHLGQHHADVSYLGLRHGHAWLPAGGLPDGADQPF
jgi:fatty-acyl-CoA synthase